MLTVASNNAGDGALARPFLGIVDEQRNTIVFKRSEVEEAFPNAHKRANLEIVEIGEVHADSATDLKENDFALVEMYDEPPILLYELPGGRQYMNPPGGDGRVIGVHVATFGKVTTVE